MLRPNPGYGGDRPQRLSEIDVTGGGAEPKGIAEVEAGNADAVSLTPGQQGVERIQAQYGPHSDAASAGDQRLFSYPMLAESYLALNLRRDLFSSTRMRKVVNYAIDRRALARQPPPSWFGQPTDQYLPPGMPGFRDASIYPLDGPDLARARRLAGSHGGHAVMYTCNLPSCLAVAQVVRKNLSAIGLAVEIRQFPYNTLYNKLARPDEPWDIADTGWIAGYADPSEFLNVLFAPPNGQRPPLLASAQFEKGFNLGGFDDPTLQRRLRAAAELSGARRYRAYARLDADLTRAAPLAAYAADAENYFFSTRMGCQVVQPVYGLDLAALCVRP